VTTVRPVLVIVVPAKTAKLAADPRATGVAAIAGNAVTKLKLNTSTKANKILQIFVFML
jgi:hypothetical protein